MILHKQTQATVSRLIVLEIETFAINLSLFCFLFVLKVKKEDWTLDFPEAFLEDKWLNIWLDLRTLSCLEGLANLAKLFNQPFFGFLCNLFAFINIYK